MADPIKIVVNASNPAKIIVNQGPITVIGGGGNSVPLLDKSGTIIDYFTNTTVFGTANATNAMATGDFIYDGGAGAYTKATGSLWVGSSYEQAFSGVYQPSAASAPHPKMTFFDGNSEASLELLTVPGAGTSIGIEAKTGGTLYYEAQNANCILTRGYADTRYIRNESTLGNLTVTDSVAFAGGVQCELSAPTLGEKVIQYALNGGARTDWLANSTTPGHEGKLFGASVAGSSGGAALQKLTFNTYPSNGTYTQIFLTDTDATLLTGAIGSGVALTKTWSPNSLLTQVYADTRYVPIANLTGTGFNGKVFVGGVFGAPTANLVSGVVDERGVKQFITSYRDGANITQIWVDKSRAMIYGSPTGSGPDSAEISASRDGGIGLRTGNNQDATLVKQGTQLWSDDSILTREYADTRYVPSVKSVVQLYPNNGKLYLNANEISPDVQYICEMSSGMVLLRETILAPGRYTIRILNTLGSPLEIGTGISMPEWFDLDNDLGQNPGNITILEFIAYADPPSYLFLTSSRVY